VIDAMAVVVATWLPATLVLPPAWWCKSWPSTRSRLGAAGLGHLRRTGDGLRRLGAAAAALGMALVIVSQPPLCCWSSRCCRLRAGDGLGHLIAAAGRRGAVGGHGHLLDAVAGRALVSRLAPRLLRSKTNRSRLAPQCCTTPH